MARSMVRHGAAVRGRRLGIMAAMSYATARRQANADLNKLQPEDRPVHEWYRFVLSFPPHLVRQYVERLGFDGSQRVLDPFCGTGTVLVECKKRGIPSVGVEANPMAHFASRVKVNWRPDPAGLLEHAQEVAAAAERELARAGLHDDPALTQGVEGAELRRLAPDAERLLLRDSISPLPLHKTLVLLDCLDRNRGERYRDHELLALAKAVVLTSSNLHFGPEVGVGPAKRDAPVIAPWLAAVGAMADDLVRVGGLQDVPAVVHHGDSRHLRDMLEPQSVDGIITSPPYPNEKDYTRTTRLESVLLGFIRDRADLRALKQGLLRSNTRNVYKADDDDRWVAEHPEIQRIAAAIEARRVELGKTSGFERLYGRVTRLYFGGMARHLADLRAVLRPGARLAYVVGDQASYLRVMIRTGHLLAEIAWALGYEPAAVELFRTRRATATGEDLREEVVVLRWPGAQPRVQAEGPLGRSVRAVVGSA
ncbi:MAG TPA: DNA methyltransferase [Chloroflexota bacterium]|nr:DNA methyltransferase [Chloroflexota bacterium]